MSDRAVQSYYASAEKTSHPLHNYQSLDMSHSSGASFNNARQEQNQLSSPLGHATMNYPSSSEVDNASDISGPPRGFRNIESRSTSLTTRSRNFSNYKPSWQGYPISDLYQPSGRGFVFRNDQGTNDVQVLKSQLARNFDHSNNALCISRGEFSSVHPVTPLWTETSHSPASQIQPQGYILAECIDERGRSSAPSVICRQENANHLLSMQAFRKNSRDTDLRILEQGYGNYQSDSTLLLNQEKKDICSTSRKSVIPVSRKDDGSFLMLNDVSPKHNNSQGFFQEQHQGIQNLSEIGLFPSWSSSSKLEMIDQQHCSHTGSRSAHDVKTMRTYPPVNFVKRASEDPHVTSQTTRSLLNGESFNVSFCKENRLFEKSGVLDLNKNSCQLSGHSQQGVKLQLLDSLTDSGGIENVQHPSSFLFVSKNESSAETGALNTDIKEIHLSGAKSFPVNKDFMMHVKLTSTDAFASPEEVRSKLVFSEIPDLNTALPDLPDADNLMGNLDSSTHKTKSLETGLLHAVEPAITSRRRKRRKISDVFKLK